MINIKHDEMIIQVNEDTIVVGDDGAMSIEYVVVGEDGEAIDYDEGVVTEVVQTFFNNLFNDKLNEV